MVVTQNATSATERQVEKRAYSIRELAEAYGVSVSLVRLEIARKRLRTLRIGDRVLIPVEAVEQWLRLGDDDRRS